MGIMLGMAHEPGSVRARLGETVPRVWKMYCALELVIPHPDSQHSEPISRQKLVASSPAWHSQAAHLVLEFHEHVRRVEASLAQRISGRIRLVRGASQENTEKALYALPKLAEAVDDATVLELVAYLDQWFRRGQSAIFPEMIVHHLPRNPGEGEARCPHCHYQTMRWFPAQGIAFCVNPICANDSGKRPQWCVEYMVSGGLMSFSWRETTAESA